MSTGPEQCFFPFEVLLLFLWFSHSNLCMSAGIYGNNLAFDVVYVFFYFFAALLSYTRQIKIVCI